MTTEKNSTSRFDFNLVFILFLLFIASCIAIYSAQSTGQYGENFLLKQIVWYGIGAVIIAVMIAFDSDQLKKAFLVLLWTGAPSSWISACRSKQHCTRD